MKVVLEIHIYNKTKYMKNHVWVLDFKTFSGKVRAIHNPQYCADYFRLGKRHQIGCHYYLYVDSNLNIINPYTKRDQGKKVLKSFVSTCSREAVSYTHLTLPTTSRV